jgi:ParB family chromosome partitioning protein
LSALISEGTEPEPSGESGVRQVAVSDVQASARQPRQRFHPGALAELAASIREHGVLQPLLVRETAAGSFELIAGERRLRAAAEAGLQTVPVLVTEAADRDALEIALIENVQREDLNVLEEAEAYRMLAERYGATQEDIARRVGRARATVANTMRLLDLPEDVRGLVADGKLSAGHAKVVSGLAAPEKQRHYAERACRENLSVRNLEAVIERDARPPRKARAERRDIPAGHLQYVADRLHAHFGSAVRITSCRTYANGKKGKGRIEIDYYSSEDLTRLLDVLGIELE